MIQFLRAIVRVADTRKRLQILEHKFEDLRQSALDERLDDIRRAIHSKPKLVPGMLVDCKPRRASSQAAQDQGSEEVSA